MKVEIFSAGCKFCNGVETKVREVVGKNHEVVVYNIDNENASEKYYQIAKAYEVNSLPSVVVNGKLLTCCSRKGFDPALLSQVLQSQ